MPLEAKELADRLDTAASAVTALQSRLDEQGSKLDAIDLDMMQKAAKEAADAHAEIQKSGGHKRFEELYGTVEDQKERIKSLELAAATGQHKDVGKGDKSAYYKALSAATRTPKNLRQVDDELQKQNVEGMMAFYCPHLTDEAKSVMTKAYVAGSGPDGGYWVPVDRQQRMIERIFETTPMRQLASVISIGTNETEMIIDDGEISVTRGTELTPFPATATPKIGLLKIPVHEMLAHPAVTMNMLEDATIDIVGHVSNKAERDFGRAESTDFVIGNGADRSTGFLTMAAAADPDVYQRNTLGRVDATDGLGVGIFFGGDDLINVQNHLKEPFQGNASWLMKRRSFFNVATLKDNDGQYLLRFGDQLAENVRMQLLGRPVVFGDDMEAIADNSQSIAYGDFRQGYQIVDRIGISMLPDPFTQPPFVFYRFRRRVGGHTINFEAIKILRSGNGLAP